MRIDVWKKHKGRGTQQFGEAAKVQVVHIKGLNQPCPARYEAETILRFRIADKQCEIAMNNAEARDFALEILKACGWKLEQKVELEPVIK